MPTRQALGYEMSIVSVCHSSNAFAATVDELRRLERISAEHAAAVAAGESMTALLDDEIDLLETMVGTT